MTCQICDASPSSDLWSSPRWRVFIARDQDYLGKCIVALRRHEEDFLALAQDERDDMWETARAVRDALARCFAPDHFNYQVLGNSVRHVHMHLTPRYTAPREFGGRTFTDNHWGAWPFPAEQDTQSDFLENIADTISRELPKGAGE